MSELMNQLQAALRSRHYSRRTEQAYCLWVRRFIRFHGLRHPCTMGGPEINAFVTHLAVAERVNASTQTQALSALLFLYRRVLGRDVDDFGELVRARHSRRLPVVLTRDEVKAILAQLEVDRLLAASLVYGSGLKLMECLRLRAQDIEFTRGEIIVRDGKGGKDRVTMLPRAVRPALHEQLTVARAIHRQDLADGWGRVELPEALERKYPALRPSGAGSGSSPSSAAGPTAAPAIRVATTCTPPSSSAPSRTPSSAPASPSTPPATLSATPLPLTCSRPATTSAPSRSSSATGTWARPWSTPTYSDAARAACAAHSTDCDESPIADATRKGIFYGGKGEWPAIRVRRRRPDFWQALVGVHHLQR
jgi:hypothetical protein